MELRAVRVQRWRNFVDSGWVDVEPDVTCMVGKNESGKTALLEALYRLRPAGNASSKLDVDLDYPRWRKVQDERSSDISKQQFVQARFALDDDDLQAIAEHLGVEVPSTTTLLVGRDYKRTRYVTLELVEQDVVDGLLGDSSETQGKSPATSLEGLTKYVKESGRTDLKGVPAKIKKLAPVLAQTPEELRELLWDRVPQFFYFSDYSRLTGHVDLHHITETKAADLEDHERTALHLLELVGASEGELSVDGLERRLAGLEAAAAEITRQVFKYWSQNRHLRVQLVTVEEVVKDYRGSAQAVNHRFLDIRLLDQRHHVTTNFETRSSGFRWFFSFIVAFNPFRERQDVIVLLDEPGLSLHGRAQADFLDFVNQELAPSSQVIYTTHSPFLVDPARLERVRLVEDHTSEEDPDAGATVSDEPLTRDADTMFPLQAALGYDLAQNLFIGAAEHLVIEGSTDLVYLETMSEHLKTLKRVGLDDRFSMVPVGGAQNIPTFVALLGAHLPATVLVDSSTKGLQRLQHLVRQGLLEQPRLVMVGDVLDVEAADIEDLFSVDDYLRLYNAAYGTKTTSAKLDGKGPILRQLERHRGEKFEHGPPATALLRAKADVLGALTDETLSRFESLFERLNATLPSP